MRLTALALATVLGFAAANSATAADNYKVDPVHTTAIFKITHFNVAPFYGRFNVVTGTFSLDDSDASKSTFEFEVNVDKVDTGNEKRDNHLRGPDFFNTKQFPTAKFKSTSVKPGEGNTLEVTGDLTLHGVTKPVTAKVEKTGQGNTPAGQRAGLATTFTIKRTDFGMSFMLQGLGDEITLMFGIEGVKQ